MASLVVGLVGAMFGLIPLLFWLAFPLAVLALVFGGVGFRHGLGKAGITLGAVALCLGVVGAILVSDAADDLAGDGDDSDRVALGSSAPTSSPAHDTTKDSEPVTETPSEAQKRIGETLTIASEDLTTEFATITFIDVQSTQAAPNEFSDGPRNGWFVTATLTITASETGTFDVDAFDFYVRDADGRHFDYTAGNALETLGDGGELDSSTLNPAETITGTITFDVPHQHGELVYSPAFTAEQRALGSWEF